jgi:hypothetical protein
MPLWLQIFFALMPVAFVIMGGVYWVVRRISHLEGKVDVIVTLLQALTGFSAKIPDRPQNESPFRAPGS